MEIAIDRKAGTRVTAEEAKRKARRGRWTYLCPACGAPVDLRDGPVYSAYFAHQPGTASDDCRYYHPGGEDSWVGSGRPPTPDGDVRPLSLCLTVRDSGRPEPAWGLALLVPQCPSGTGTVLVRDAVAGLVPLPCSSLRTRDRVVPVSPRTDSYRVEVSGDVDPAYARRVTATIPPLELNRGNVFRGGSRGGKRLPDDTALIWGRSYYVVWYRGLSIPWPAALQRQPFEDFGVMRCARVVLPSISDEATTSWVDELLARSIERPAVTLTVVAPVVSATELDDSLLLDADAEPVIAIIQGPGLAAPTALWISGASAASPTRVGLPAGGGVLFLSLGRLGHGRTRIGVEVDDDEDDVITIDSQKPPAEPEMPMAAFTLREQDGREHAIPAYSPEAASALKRVRAGASALLNVILPPRFECVIRTRMKPFDGWKQVVVRWSREESAQDLPAHDRSRVADATSRILEALLSGAELDVEFDNFGHVHIGGCIQGRVEHTHTIPNGLRQRLRWLLSTVSTARKDLQVSGREMGTPPALDAVLRIARMKADSVDRAFLTEFAGRQRWPVSVEPQLRVLTTELRALFALPRSA